MGVLVVEFLISRIEQLLQTMNLSQSGTIYLLDKSGLFVASSFHKLSDSLRKQLPNIKTDELFIQEIANNLFISRKSDFNQI